MRSETCENKFAEARKKPFRQTPKHGEIEQNLTAAYHQYLSSLEA
jgi:hypothetical protein